MGLFSYVVGYKAAKRRARRRQVAEENWDDMICDNCGYARRRHSDEGTCPNYS